MKVKNSVIALIGLTLLGVVSLTLWSFRKRTMSVSEYVKFVQSPDGPFVKTKKIGEYEVSVMLKPALYQVIETYGREVLNMNIDSVIKDYERSVCATWKLKRTDGASVISSLKGSTERKASILEHYQFGNEGDLTLILDEDTISPIGYHLEATGNLDPGLTFHSVFQYSNTEDDLIMSYHDQVLNIGRLNFSFDNALMSNEIIINNE